MPAAPTHIDFALDCLARRPAADLPDLPAETRGAFLVGAQGSDPFYTYGRLPWRKRERSGQAQAFADFIHGSDPAEVFPPLASRVASAEGANKRALAAYLYGLLLHYLLDRAIHPYVYYRTGFDADGLPVGIYSLDHLRFETALAAVMRARRPEPTVERALPVADKATLAAVGDLFASTFPGRVESGDFPAAWSDFNAVRRLIRDPWGLKAAALDLFGISSPFRAMMRSDRPSIGDRIDYANEGRTLWMRPADGKPSGARVRELYEEALAEADRMGGFLQRAVDGGGTSEDWERLLGGTDHEGRRRGETMRYFRSVYRPSDMRLPSGL